VSDPTITRRRSKHWSATHGMSRAPEYTAWRHIKSRCDDPQSQTYKWYGARGIRVCPRLRDSFEAFFAEAGPRPSKKHSIVRSYPDAAHV